ncbi:hypothetical protein [Terribacillus sp. JSM ZJ617]|uniref:hypothetical protein n=1 Tax=Terribacillus sp. JSM ZJ617 TaxID=3342119 RepID=UPI0035A82FA5
MSLEYFNEGNHNEEPGTHLQYESYKARTPRNGVDIAPTQWTKLIDRVLYFDSYLQANPQSVRPPAVKKFVTSFFLNSANTDSGFLSAIVTLRVNIYQGDSKFSLDVTPLINTVINNRKPDYNDLLRLYVQDFGDGRYNVKLFLKYALPLSTYRIKVINTSLNDNAYYYAYVDRFNTEYGLDLYPDTEYRMNQWLFVRDEDMTLVPETTLPSVGSSISLIKSNSILTNIDIPIKDQHYVSGAAGTTRGYHLQTNGVERFAIRIEDGAESGSNKGSDLSIIRRSDDGSFAGQPMAINRQTGDVAFKDGITSVNGSYAKPFLLGNTYIWINNDGDMWQKTGSKPSSVIDGEQISRFVSVPSSSTAAGKPGDWSANGTHLFICYSKDMWRRITLENW